MTDFSLIETMRAEPAKGLVRGNLHRARLFNSIRKLDFKGAEEAWRAVVARSAIIEVTSRLRLELWRDGHFEITDAPYVALPEELVWTVRISRSAKAHAGQPLLRHKTSLRDHYNKARSEYAVSEADEVLLLNQHDELAEGTITNLFVEASDGTLLTPPLSSGCLAGVLRTSLICSKKARVAVIHTQHLREGQVYVGNSLRGLIRARLVE